MLVQLEDFANVNAFRPLARYRDRVPSFNDDIQGTGAIGLAGEANIGIGTIVAATLERAGLSASGARRRCWFIDSKGLVTTLRTDLAPHKRRFAQDHVPLPDLRVAVEAIRPPFLIGAGGQAGAFTEPVLAAMARLNEQPVIFALSNPTAKAECTAEQAYRATQGRAIFASGSPSAPVTLEGRTFVTPGRATTCTSFPASDSPCLPAG